ncbi:MAG: hypothetical protein HY047_08400 [Acidobacteria bacterium]|nr:hypothetical protein [Acidobacteriota bacterium]
MMLTLALVAAAISIGSVHTLAPDHNGVFYARLPNWDRVEGGAALAGTEPHEVERLFSRALDVGVQKRVK